MIRNAASSSRPAGPRARVLMPSLRRLNPHAAWCSNYEFEDVIRAVDDVELLELEPAPLHAARERLARSVAWRGRSVALASLNPGVKPVVVDADYDVFAFVCMNVWDILYLNAIRGWDSRCRVKLCYMVEFYAGMEDQFGHFLRLLGRFDHVFQAFSGSVETVGRRAGRPCHHMPLASDVQRFTPFPRLAPRAIDVLSVGRRSEQVHAALRGLAAARGLFYVHDTLPGALVRPTDPNEHRDMLANLSKRSRFFITYPAKFGDRENQGQSEAGARYFEGSAAGAILLGQAPTAPAFRDAFPHQGAVVEARPDGSDVAEVIDRLGTDPAGLDRLALQNARLALRRHDWAHRWQAMLALGGLPERPALRKRLDTLAALAEGDRAGATP